MTIKVIHWGTGNAGRQVLKHILSNRHFQLVGFGVHDPAKEGRDAGEFCGMPDTGILATRDWGRLLATDADCATYIINEWSRDSSILIDEICELLGSGKNVITTSYVPLVYPAALGREVTVPLSRACERGGTSFHCTGIEPGFTGDALVLTMSSLSRDISRIRIQEKINVASYDEPQQLKGYGFGKSPQVDTAEYEPGHMTHLWSGVFHMLADGLGLKLDRLEETREVEAATRTIQLPSMRIQPGEIAGIYFRIDGIVSGAPRLSLSHTYVVDERCGAQWEPVVPPERQHHRTTRIIFDGAPPMTMDLALGGQGLDPTEMGLIATAARVVNAIPVVCAQAPGISTFLNMYPVIAQVG